MSLSAIFTALWLHAAPSSFELDRWPDLSKSSGNLLEKAQEPRSSSREVRIRVPTYFFLSILVGEPSQPTKEQKGTWLGDLVTLLLILGLLCQ